MFSEKDAARKRQKKIDETVGESNRELFKQCRLWKNIHIPKHLRKKTGNNKNNFKNNKKEKGGFYV